MKRKFEQGDVVSDRLAVSVLQWLSEDEERLNTFLGLSGLTPDTLRRSARDPGFLVAVLDFVVGDEDCLVACAKGIGVRPEAIADAWRRLQPPEFDHWL